MNEPITIYMETGTQTRSFCFVSDLIRGFDLLMHSEAEVPGPVNFWETRQRRKILDLASKIIQMIGSRFETHTASDAASR